MKSFVIIIFTLLLCACSSPSIDDYKSFQPTLRLEQFFNGNLTAHGVVLDRQGNQTRTFVAKIKAHWQDDTGTLEEWFTFNDGEKSKRTWVITKTPDGYQGTANDVIGIAYGKTAGNALYWRYDLEIDYQGSKVTVTLDDWMYLISEDVLINKSEIIKFGLHMGEVILTIKKHP